MSCFHIKNYCNEIYGKINFMFNWFFIKQPSKLSQEISKRRPLRPKANKMVTRPNDYIAMRLPRRQAKQNALKFYMEDLDVEERSNSDEEVTFPHKRKLKNFISENHDFPIKDSRIRKISKNALKSVTHGRQLLKK